MRPTAHFSPASKRYICPLSRSFGGLETLSHIIYWLSSPGKREREGWKCWNLTLCIDFSPKWVSTLWMTTMPSNSPSRKTRDLLSRRVNSSFLWDEKIKSPLGERKRRGLKCREILFCSWLPRKPQTPHCLERGGNFYATLLSQTFSFLQLNHWIRQSLFVCASLGERERKGGIVNTANRAGWVDGREGRGKTEDSFSGTQFVRKAVSESTINACCWTTKKNLQFFTCFDVQK